MRDVIRAELTAIVPFDDLEREHWADALAWVDSGAPLCRTAKPATPAQHLVAYFVVVDVGHILLVDHRNAGLWLPTGGHVEPGEHPRATVEREIEEELGIVPQHAVGAPLMVTRTVTVGATAGHTDVSLWYVIQRDRHDPLDVDAREFECARWFERSHIPVERSEPNLSRFVAKLKGAGLPLDRASQ